MVAQNYRWDFIGLSTDSKPAATNPKVADGSTYYESNTSKLFVWYKDRWYEKTATGGYELPIASASTLGGVKVGEGLEISEAGVLSASGGGGGSVTILTADDYNYPENNPTYIALWLLPAGNYYVDNSETPTIDIRANANDTNELYHATYFTIFKAPSSSGKVMIHALGSPFDADGDGTFAYRIYCTKSDGSNYGNWVIEPTGF